MTGLLSIGTVVALFSVLGSMQGDDRWTWRAIALFGVLLAATIRSRDLFGDDESGRS